MLDLSAEVAYHGEKAPSLRGFTCHVVFGKRVAGPPSRLRTKLPGYAQRTQPERFGLRLVRRGAKVVAWCRRGGEWRKLDEHSVLELTPPLRLEVRQFNAARTSPEVEVRIKRVRVD